MSRETIVDKVRRARRVAARFSPLLLTHRRRMAMAGACAAGYLVMDLLAPWPIQIVLDGVLLDKPAGGALRWLGGVLPADRSVLLLVGCAAVLVIAALRGVFSYGQNLLSASVGHAVVADLRVSLFDRLQRLSLAFHKRHRTGDLLVRLTGDITLLREILVPAVLESATRLLVIVAMLALMVWMDPVLTAIAATLLPLLAMATVRFGAKIRAVTREQRRKEGRVAAVAGEALASVPAVQAYSREAATVERFSRNTAKGLRAGLRTLRLEESLARTVELTLAVGTALVLWVGAGKVRADAMSPGELVVFLAYLRGIYRPLQALVRLASKGNKAIACGERVIEVLDADDRIEDVEGAVPAPPLRGEIVFDRVTFGYDPHRPVLRDVSFRVSPGEKVGLIGPSGAGKSTIAALMLRLYDPQQGRILVDGRDIRTLTVDSYRKQVAAVLQEPFLFGVTAAENIRFGRPDATDDEVLAAARAAEADEFLLDLPAGFDTVLGERGSSLSRGQQQRVALARAVVRRAPILVLDEPTTGLDARAEEEVLSALARAADGHTCLWIAHDVDQILGCPRVVVIRDGRLVDDGAPRRLLARSGTLVNLLEGAVR